MWTAPVLLWILGSTALWVLAQPDILSLEDHTVTPAVEVSTVSPSKEDHIPTTSSSAAPHQTTRALTTAEITGIEDVSTPGRTTHSHLQSQTTTASPLVTSTSSVNVTTSTQTDVDKDSLSASTLAGIVFGVLIAFAFLSGILFLFVRKMSK